MRYLATGIGMLSHFVYFLSRTETGVSSLKFDVYSAVILAIRHCQRRRQQNRCRWSFLDETGSRNLKRSPVASFQLQKPVYYASFIESINRFLLHSILFSKKINVSGLSKPIQQFFFVIENAYLYSIVKLGISLSFFVLIKIWFT